MRLRLSYFTFFMNLREGEEILKIYHHHPTPFVMNILKVIAGVFPFYLALFAVQGLLTTGWYIILHLIVLLIFSLVIVYVSLIYWLDRLIITNERIIHIDYKFITVRDDSAADLKDIQDIQTHERGFLSYFWIFDYGTFSMDTASSYVAITFLDAPDPEAIRQFVFYAKNKYHHD